MGTKNRIDLMFRAFADETRLRILYLLTLRRELCVCDFERILGVGQSKVSRHLAYLRRCGLVETRAEGKWSYYGLAIVQSRFHKRLVACVRDCFSEVPALAKDRRRLESRGRGAACV